MKILIADDDRQGAEILESFLKKLGHGTHIANNGDDALAFMNVNKYDLAFLDQDMPVLTGLDLATHVKEKKLKTRVVIVTAHNFVVNSMFKLLGVHEYIKKPYNLKDILKALENTAVQ